MEGDGGEEQLKQENQRQKSYRKPQDNSQNRHKSDGVIGDPWNRTKCVIGDHDTIDITKEYYNITLVKKLLYERIHCENQLNIFIKQNVKFQSCGHVT